MLRLLALMSVLTVTGLCRDAMAQRFHSRSYRSQTQYHVDSQSWQYYREGRRTPYQQYPANVPVYGFGYVYDPYRTGSFRAPDLHDDPLFQAQHKFDSHFPGRYKRRPKLQLRTTVPSHLHW